jgi:hypothetical protein
MLALKSAIVILKKQVNLAIVTPAHSNEHEVSPAMKQTAGSNSPITRSTAILLTVLALGSPAVQAACFKPETPDTLDANTDKETFQRTYQATQAYLQAADAYLKCLNLEQTDTSAMTEKEEKANEKEKLKNYNDTVDSIRAVSSNMKEQEQKFKAQLTE